jgi:HEPN domain-containing protein
MKAYEAMLMRGRSNLEKAKLVFSPSLVLYDDMCFETQQAAEKAFKALLLYFGVEKPEYTHKIEILLEGIEQFTSIPDNIRLANKLTSYATKSRYSFTPDATKEDYEEAVKLASDCLAWVEETIQKQRNASRQ